MNNLDDSEKNAKVSDSAYSNSCSNSQSRRSHCSKSTHSGSNSSGSSGYGGRPDTNASECSTNDLNQEKRTKDKEVKAGGKKKKKTLIGLQATGLEKENEWPLAPVLEAPKEDNDDTLRCPFALAISETATHCVDICTSDTFYGIEGSDSNNTPNSSVGHIATGRSPWNSSGAFSCVMSLNDGVVVYAPPSVTTTLGYPKDMWVGRSFIDFLHPRDRTTFASQITNGLNMPNINNSPHVKAYPQDESICSIICRVRQFKGLTTGFAVKNRPVGFLPYLLKFFLKDIIGENGANVYLVIMAIPFFSAYKTPNEIVTHPTPFIIKHSAIGNIEHIDIDAVRYLGYLPQEILEKDALQLYHPGDLVQIRHIYETIVQNGFVPRTKPYRMITQNGHYLILESEWSSLVNPWSKRLEFIIGKHYVLEGPSVPDVFQVPDFNNILKLSEEEKAITIALKQSIRRVMNENLTIPAQAFKLQINKRNQDIADFVDQFIEVTPKPEEEPGVQDEDNCCLERGTVTIGGISIHNDTDSKSDSDTPLSYNQLNYNENLERFFNSHEPYEDYDLDYGGEIWKGKKINNADSKMLSSLDSSSIDNLSDSSGVIRISSTNEDTNDESDKFRLTKYLLQKHNADMEKELVKIHHKKRITSKSEREKALHDSLQNKMEHFARCNALYLPTNAELSSSDSQSHGLKRSSKHIAQGSANKQRCQSPRTNKTQSSTNVSNTRIAATSTTIAVTPSWQGNTVNNANAFVLGVPQPMSILSPMPMQGVIPVYFGPIPQPEAAGNGGSDENKLKCQAFAKTTPPYFPGSHNEPSTSTGIGSDAAPTGVRCHMQHAIPCMMIGQAVYNSPMIYPAIEQQVYAMQQSYAPQSANVHNIGLSNRNYEEATVRLPQDRTSRKTRRCESEKETTRTESNYSSFYSSFFKTESSSTTDDSDVRNRNRNNKPFCRKKRRTGSSLRNLSALLPNKLQPQKENEKEQICLNSELTYKYQIVTGNMEEVLANDKKKLESLQQPLLVKQQLGQLYLDLQLQGVAARLTLEEGITSSSSEEEIRSKTNKVRRSKQRHDKLGMIHEENAPLPSPDESSSSTS